MTRIPLLMTGANGLVGSRFVELFGDKYEIFNIDLQSGVDITDRNSLSSFVSKHQAKTLIHLAAFTNTTEANKQEGDENGVCYLVNVVGTKNIIEVCKKNNIHLIHISTDYVFDGTKTTAYTEEDERNPIDWYGKTKAMAEVEVENSGLSYTIFRIAYPYRANFEAKPDIIQKIKNGLDSKTLPLQFADTIITPTFIDDIAKVFDLAITKGVKGLYHLVGGSSVSPYELAVLVAQMYGFPPSIVKRGGLAEYLESNPRPYAQYSRISNKKLIEEFDYTPLTLPEGLKELRLQQVAC